MHVCIYSALVGLESKMCKMHGTNIKYINPTFGENLLTFTFRSF